MSLYDKGVFLTDFDGEIIDSFKNKDVKQFIKDVLYEDIQWVINDVNKRAELMDRIKKRAGEELCSEKEVQESK